MHSALCLCRLCNAALGALSLSQASNSGFICVLKCVRPRKAVGAPHPEAPRRSLRAVRVEGAGDVDADGGVKTHFCSESRLGGGVTAPELVKCS